MNSSRKNSQIIWQTPFITNLNHLTQNLTRLIKIIINISIHSTHLDPRPIKIMIFSGSDNKITNYQDTSKNALTKYFLKQFY